MPKLEPSPLPTGTPDEIAGKGQSPARWGSCAPQNSSHPVHGPVMGCPFYATCKFGRSGPVNKGVYLQVADGSSRQIETPCYDYMGSLLAREKDSELTGEVIAVIADEGEEIEVVRTVSADPVNCNKNGNMAMKQVKEVVKVKPFPRPGEEGSRIPPDETGTKDFVRKILSAQKQERLAERLGVTSEPKRRGRPPKARDEENADVDA